jgi:hypothetical protein
MPLCSQAHDKLAKRLALLVAVALFVAACRPAQPPSALTPPPSQTASTTFAGLPLEPAAVHPVTEVELGATWRAGCPVGAEQLRRVEVNHLGFDGRLHRGELIVQETVVPEVITIFEQLLQLGYPIEKMRNVNEYRNAEDELSMEDNNTSAFNCRGMPGSGGWSWHAYGRAVDINPLLNPYIDGTGHIEPNNAEVYLDRHRIDPGLLHDGDAAVRAFTDRGWTWGGNWKSPIDYQHFERP